MNIIKRWLTKFLGEKQLYIITFYNPDNEPVEELTLLLRSDDEAKKIALRYLVSNDDYLNYSIKKEKTVVKD